MANSGGALAQNSVGGQAAGFNNVGGNSMANSGGALAQNSVGGQAAGFNNVGGNSMAQGIAHFISNRGIIIKIRRL